MLYSFLKLLVHLGIKLFYKRVFVSGQQHIPAQGPLVFVANHPNSFMDALLVAAYTKRKLYFLARGDAFTHPILNRIFRAFNMLPVYRASEGKENINKNFSTFDVVHEALQKGYAILIFGEGLSENDWDLRPQKKGAARIAQRAWQSNDVSNLKIVPVGLTFEHYRGAGKSAVVNYGAAFGKEDVNGGNTFVQQFNQHIITQTIQLAYINPALKPNTPAAYRFNEAWQQVMKQPNDVVKQLYETFPQTTIEHKKLNQLSLWHKLIFTWPFYSAMAWIADRTTKNTIFYDAVLFGLTILLFPFYLLLCFGVLKMLL